MGRTLVIIFGANGGVASMLIKHLILMKDTLIVTCGSRQCAELLEFYPWNFGKESPIPEILKNHFEYKKVIVLYSAIEWPKSEADVEINFKAFKTIIETLPVFVRFISISSFAAATSGNSLYTKLKRRQELLCQSYPFVSLRLGMIDAQRPFGQSVIFYQLARLLHVVPVPFYNARVSISKEADIFKAILDIMNDDVLKTARIVEVKSMETTFIQAIRGVLNKADLKYVCIPIPNFIANGLVNLIFKVARNSWISERLQGLKAFATS